MRSVFHFHSYSRLVIVAVLAVALFVLYQSVVTRATPPANPPRDAVEIGGWAWSELVGWISLNCENDIDGDGVLDDSCLAGPGGDWGLYLDNDGNVKGCAYAGTPLNRYGQCSISGDVCELASPVCPGSETCDPLVLGWICFSDVGGVPEAPANGVDIVDSSAALNSFESANGYAHIVSFNDYSDDEAKKLRFPIGYSTADAPISGCFNCYLDPTYKCSIEHWVDCDCAQDGDGYLPETCPHANCLEVEGEAQVCQVLYLDNDDNRKCDNCLDYAFYQEEVSYCQETNGVWTSTICDEDGDCSAPDTCEIRFVPGDFASIIAGYSCSDCTFENVEGLEVVNNTCGINAYDTNINRCETCESFYNMPGLIIDNKHNTIQRAIDNNECSVVQTDTKEPDFCERASLCGWTWNAMTDGTPLLGWLQFSPHISTTTKPYFSVEEGSIYSKGNIFNRYTPPYGKFNASYLIEAGGTITNLVSSSTLAGLYQGELPNRPEIGFLGWLAANQKYTNALGSLDYIGMITEASNDGLDSFNKYGSKITSVSTEAEFDALFNQALDGQVIYIEGSQGPGTIAPTDFAELNLSQTVLAGGIGERGSGIIIVDANLIINDGADIEYEVGPVISNLKQIPSLVWIIRGDLIVNPTVSKIHGTFIILGQDGELTCAAPTCNDLGAIFTEANCGQMVTCAGVEADCDDTPLEVRGNVMARQFELCRGYYTNNDPAERFINDGRLQSNPPPGLEDFSKVVPRFSENPY